MSLQQQYSKQITLSHARTHAHTQTTHTHVPTPTKEVLLLGDDDAASHGLDTRFALSRTFSHASGCPSINSAVALLTNTKAAPFGAPGGAQGTVTSMTKLV